MVLEEDPRHPFPYFNLPVTRDIARIQKTVDDRYQVEKKKELNKVDKMRLQYKLFSEYVLLIAEKEGMQTGYRVKPEKVEAIVQKCLPPMESHVLSMVHPHDKLIHPQQLQHALEAARRQGIGDDVSRPFFQEVLKRHHIREDSKAPPPAPKIPPKPVEDLVAETTPGNVRLRWKLPREHCDCAVVTRSETGQPGPKDQPVEVRGVEWLDNHVEPGKTYYYAVFSVFQDSGPQSAKAVSAAAWGRIDGFQAVARGKAAHLSWKTPRNPQRIAVLRGTSPVPDVVDAQGRPRPLPGLKTIDLDRVQEYDDEDVVPGGTYYYRVVAYHPNGTCSPSECLCVSFAKGPPAPTEFKGVVVPGRIHLSWAPVTAVRNPVYQLERYQTAESLHRRSAAKRIALRGNTYEDANVEPGKAYWYSVSTESEGVSSATAVRCGPLLAVAEVSELRARSSAGQVELVWKSPPGVHRVEVRRAVGRVPAAPGAAGAPGEKATLLGVVEPGRLIDAALANGTTYGYRISCVFKHSDGHEVSTRGEAITATPCEVPPLFHNLKAKADGGISLSWTAIAGVRAVVIRAAGTPAFPLGRDLPLNQLDGLGHAIRATGGASATDPSPSPHEPYYLLFSANAHLAAYCGTALYLELPSFTARVEKNHLLAQWHWPPDCRQVQVCCRILVAGQSPRPHWEKDVARGKAPEATVSIPFQEAAEYEIHARCVVPPGVNAVPGPGKTLRVSAGRAQLVRWELKRPGLFGWIKKRPVELLIHADGVLCGVTSLVLAGKVNQVPEQPTDGRPLAEWSGSPAPNDGVVAIPVRDWPEARGKVYCRLFAEPPESIAILHPSFEDMVLHR